MTSTSKPGDRGSAKLFGIELHDYAALAQAIGASRDDYEVKWWWRYGQPAFDRIRLTIEVDNKNFGSALTKFMQINGRQVQVTAECFPYGIVAPDRYRVELDLQKTV